MEGQENIVVEILLSNGGVHLYAGKAAELHGLAQDGVSG